MHFTNLDVVYGAACQNKWAASRSLKPNAVTRITDLSSFEVIYLVILHTLSERSRKWMALESKVPYTELEKPDKI